jgi:hypothetical protein
MPHMTPANSHTRPKKVSVPAAIIYDAPIKREHNASPIKDCLLDSFGVN